MSFKGDEKDFLKVKNYINGYAPHEYLRIEDKEEVEDFKLMLILDNEKREDLTITEENIMKEVKYFINNVVRFSYNIKETETRISFSKGSDFTDIKLYG